MSSECLLGEPPGSRWHCKGSPCALPRRARAQQGATGRSRPRGSACKGCLGTAGHQQLPEPGPPCRSCSCRDKISSPSTAQPSPVFSWEWSRVAPKHLLCSPELPRSPLSTRHRQGSRLGPYPGTSNRFGAGGWGQPRQLVRPAQPAGAAPHAVTTLLNQSERSCTGPVLSPAFLSGAGHHLM